MCAFAAILSALRNLQEKIRRLELEKGHTELSLHAMGRDASRSHLPGDKVTQMTNGQTDTVREISGQSSCNQGGCTNNVYYLQCWCYFHFLFVFHLMMVSHYLIHSVDQPPGCCRVSLCEAGATAGPHEKDVAQCQGRQDQSAQRAG